MQARKQKKRTTEKGWFRMRGGQVQCQNVTTYYKLESREYIFIRDRSEINEVNYELARTVIKSQRSSTEFICNVNTTTVPSTSIINLRCVTKIFICQCNKFKQNNSLHFYAFHWCLKIRNQLMENKPPGQTNPVPHPHKKQNKAKNWCCEIKLWKGGKNGSSIQLRIHRLVKYDNILTSKLVRWI